ncbi:hypothetical protein ES703_83781 [subsurface metagenome]
MFRLNFIFLVKRVIIKSFAFFHIKDIDMVIDKLIHILILSTNVCVNTIHRGLLCNCADYVVGLEAIKAKDGNFHCLKNLLNSVYLCRQFWRHRRAIGLILGVDFGSEGRGFAVHRNNEHIRALIPD